MAERAPPPAKRATSGAGLTPKLAAGALMLIALTLVTGLTAPGRALSRTRRARNAGTAAYGRRRGAVLVLAPAMHEKSDVGFAPMLVAGVLMLVALGLMVGLAFWLYPKSTVNELTHGPMPSFAQPTLQPSPPADMDAFRATLQQQLNTVGWIDQARGVVHIPIADAMRDVARDGIADWPTAPRRDR